MNHEDVKVAFYLKRNESDSAGRCPVMGRLTVGRSECVFSAKMLAPRSLWVSGRAKGKSAEAVEINRRLDELRASALAIYREQSAVRERVTAEEVKCLLLGMAFGQETLLDYFCSYIEHFEKRVGVNRTIKSARTYRCACEHVARFLSERLRLSFLGFGSVVHRQVRPVSAHGAEVGSEHRRSLHVASAYGHQQGHRRRNHYCRPILWVRAAAY